MTQNQNNLEVNKQQNIPGKRAYWKEKLSDYGTTLKNFWKEFSTINYGLIGIGLFVLFLLVMIFQPFLSSFPEAGTRWRDMGYWDANPKGVPPAWINWFSGEDRALQEVFDDPEMSEKKVASMTIKETSFSYNYDYELAPDDIMLRGETKGMVTIELNVVRPDGSTIQLLKTNKKSTELTDLSKTISQTADFDIYDFAKEHDSSTVDKAKIGPIEILFAKAEKGMVTDPKALKGEYKFNLKAATLGKDSEIKNLKLIVRGSAFGVLGTDTSGRDLWSGVVSGTKWALFIGLFVSFISVTFGVFYGVTSAYLGGFADTIMMRIYEIIRSIPRLPLMIVMAAIFEPSIWILILIMCAFGWIGSVRVVRSMGLQIKEDTYVEAARALGASNMRIITKHMIPQLIPYSFASMALAVPGNIVYEATLSLLGLGDTSITTWGQILEGAYNGGAVLNGYWWWVVPPGLIIALMGMTFAFIGNAMDTILNPKMKTR